VAGRVVVSVQGVPYNSMVTVRKVARREVRLDAEHDRKLECELERRGVSFAAWVREQIDREAEQAAIEERLKLVEELANLNIDWGYEEVAHLPGDPATNLIRKAIDEAYGVADTW